MTAPHALPSVGAVQFTYGPWGYYKLYVRRWPGFISWGEMEGVEHADELLDFLVRVSRGEAAVLEVYDEAMVWTVSASAPAEGGRVRLLILEENEMADREAQGPAAHGPAALVRFAGEVHALRLVRRAYAAWRAFAERSGPWVDAQRDEVARIGPELTELSGYRRSELDTLLTSADRSRAAAGVERDILPKAVARARARAADHRLVQAQRVPRWNPDLAAAMLAPPAREPEDEG
jgi:hypothetical protein